MTPKRPGLMFCQLLFPILSALHRDRCGVSSGLELQKPLPGANFGGLVLLPGGDGAQAIIAAAEAAPDALPRALADASGLLLMRDMQAMADAPDLLVRLSRIFGPEVEDYRQTLTPAHMVHPTVPEIFLVSNTPPASRAPPRRPDPPLTADGRLPVQFPHRRGWHTDQSYRRPPPDISLFLAVQPVPRGQGQTLFADGTAAYEALPPALKARVDTLEGLHVGLSAGRGRDEVLAGETPRPLGAARAAAAPAGRARPSGDRQARAVSVRVWPDGLAGGSVRRHAARAARRRRGAAGRTDGAPDAPGIRLCPRMDAGRPGGVGQSLPGARRDLVRRRQRRRA